jgi:predicted transcriptional regulator of viral defense system
MRFLELKKIEKLYFGYKDIARALSITPQSARVTANRYVKKGFLIRAKRNIYLLKDRWLDLTREQKFILANIIQTPSYISLMSALAYYEVTTQIQQDFIESIALTRTKEVELDHTFFNYIKLNPVLYSGFTRMQGFFIAEPEKAFLDAIYLKSFGRYQLDISSIDFSKLKRKKVEEIAEIYPEKTKSYLRKNEYFSAA